MRKLFILILLCLALGVSAQITPKGSYAVVHTADLFVSTISVGSTLYDVSTQKRYVCITSALGSESLVTAIAKFKEEGPSIKDSTYLKYGNGIRIDSSGNTYTIVNISKDSTYIRAGTGISLVGSDSLHNTYTITNSSPSSGGTVTSISQGTGMLFSVNPLVTTGTIGIDTAKVMLFNDTLSAGKITTKKALIDGLALKRNLNNHDSLSTLDEKSYNSLSDKPTAWTISQITNLSDSLKTYVPKGRTLSINGTSYDLNQNRTWTIALPKDSTYVKSGTWLTLAGSDSTHNSYTVSADTAKVVGFNDTLTAGKIATKKYVEDRKMVYPGAGIPISNGSAWSSSITDAHSNWDAGYTYRLTSATGTAPLTLTLGSNALTGSVAAFSTSTTSTGVVPGSNSLGSTYYLNGSGAWAVPAYITYSAGYGLGLTGTTFYNKRYWGTQDSLKTSLTGIALITAGKVSTITDNSSNWNTAYSWGQYHDNQTLSYLNRKITISGTGNTISLPLFSKTDTAGGLVPGTEGVGAAYFINGSGAWSIPSAATNYPLKGVPYSDGSTWTVSMDTVQHDTIQLDTMQITFGPDFTLTGGVLSITAIPTLIWGTGLTLTDKTVTANIFAGSAVGIVPVSVGGTSNYLRADGAWATPGGGGSGMTWPGAAGITIYGGANAWGTSITDNHANWDNGYTYRVTSASGTAPLTLGLSSNALTGSMTQANTTTAGYLGSSDWNTFNGKRSLTNHDSLSTLDEKSYNSLTDRPTIPAAETTFGTVTSIATTAPITGGTITSSGTIGISAFAGSTPGAVPTSAGGTTNYLRADGNWAPPAGGSGMTWPATGGIALYGGSSAWGTSITDNSSNWNTAYGWGNKTAGFGIAINSNAIGNNRYWGNQDSLKTSLTGLALITAGKLTTITNNSTAWNNARAISNHDSLSTLNEKSYNSLTDKPTIPTIDTTTAGTGLVNKTRMSHLSSYPTLNQNTTGTAGGLSGQYIDWNASSGGTSIAHKPSIITGSGTATYIPYWNSTTSLANSPLTYYGSSVGVNFSQPSYAFQVAGGESTFTASFGEVTSRTAGVWSGIGIGYINGGPLYNKSGIVQEQLGDTYGRGTLHILNNGTANTTPATLSDARVSITYDGKVGIDGLPDSTLTDNGSLHIKTNALIEKRLTSYDSVSSWGNAYNTDVAHKYLNKTVLYDDVVLVPINYAETVGWGTIMNDYGNIFARFRWELSGTLWLLDECSADIANTNTDGKLCIFINGTTGKLNIKNRLGNGETFLIELTYTVNTIQ